MTGAFYSVSTLLNQMVLHCYQVRTASKSKLLNSSLEHLKVSD